MDFCTITAFNETNRDWTLVLFRQLPNMPERRYWEAWMMKPFPKVNADHRPGQALLEWAANESDDNYSFYVGLVENSHHGTITPEDASVFHVSLYPNCAAYITLQANDEWVQQQI